MARSVLVEHAIGLVRDESGAPVAYVSQFVDISEAQESRRELEFLAGHDPLPSCRTDGPCLSAWGPPCGKSPAPTHRIGVVFLDLDGLKRVKHPHGHAAGDELIVNVAKRIRSAVRDDDIKWRDSAATSLVVLIRVHDLQDAVDVADKSATPSSPRPSRRAATPCRPHGERGSPWQSPRCPRPGHRPRGPTALSREGRRWQSGTRRLMGSPRAATTAHRAAVALPGQSR